MRWVQFSSRWYLCARRSPYPLHFVSRKFLQRCLWNSFNAGLTDYGLFSFFQGRSSSASSFHASLLQAIDGVMVLASCQQVVSQAPQHFRSSEAQATWDDGKVTGSFPFTPACPGQYTQRSFSRVDVERWHIPACGSHSTFGVFGLLCLEIWFVETWQRWLHNDVAGMKNSNWMVLVVLPRKTDCLYGFSERCLHHASSHV